MIRLELDQRLLIWTLVTFGGLTGLLARFAFKPLQRILEERERRIREALEAARRAEEQAEQIRKQSADHLREAQEAAQRTVEEGRRLAAEIQRETRAQAKQEAEAALARAREELDGEVRRSLDALKTTVANLSVNIARQLIEAQIDDQKHQELVDKFVERLKQQGASSLPPGTRPR